MSDSHICPDCGIRCTNCTVQSTFSHLAEHIFGMERLPNESRAEFIARISDELTVKPDEDDEG